MAKVGSRPHAELALAGVAQLFGEAGEFDEELPGVARVDDLLDPEGFRGAKRRAQLFQPVLDLGAFAGGVGRRPDLRPVGGPSPRLRRPRAPTPPQPGTSGRKPPRGLVYPAGPP